MEGLGVEYLRQRAHALSRALFLRLDEYVDDFPTGTPVTIVRFFKQIAEESDKTIANTSDTDRLSLICQTLSDITAYSMSLLDHAHTAQTPRGLAYMMERFREHFHPDSVLLLAPISEYNYTIHDELPFLNQSLRNTLISPKRWKEISACYKNGFLVVRFPRVERENVLLHAILGHEVGHPIAADFLNRDRATTAYNDSVQELKKRIAVEFKKEIAQERSKVARTTIHNELLVECIRLRIRGLEELVSDVVAAALFGVSALFAAAEILIPDGLDIVPQHPEYYPPIRLRLRVMCDTLQKTKHLAALRKLPVSRDVKPLHIALLNHIRRIQDLIGVKSDHDALKHHRLARIAYEWVDSSIGAATKFALERVEALAYTNKVVVSELAEALERMSLGVPPGELGVFPNVSAVDWRTPILAGWARKLHLCEQKVPEWSKRRDEIAKAQSLALKGVEDALLRKEYGEDYPQALEK